jgi:hypothetical protein
MELKMTVINVIVLDEYHYEITVIDKSTTTHQVSVQPDYALKLTAGKITTKQLIKNSFEFLLARESNTSILHSFDLSVIARYFPDYEHIIAN